MLLNSGGDKMNIIDSLLADFVGSTKLSDVDIVEEDVIAHSAKGTTWKKHKYIRIEQGKGGRRRYIYSHLGSGHSLEEYNKKLEELKNLTSGQIQKILTGGGKEAFQLATDLEWAIAKGILPHPSLSYSNGSWSMNIQGASIPVNSKDVDKFIESNRGTGIGSIKLSNIDDAMFTITTDKESYKKFVEEYKRDNNQQRLRFDYRTRR